jgi:hypothetical protein
MAEEVNIGGDGTLFKGEDKELELELFLKSDPTVAVDWSTWETIVDIRKKDTSGDPAILSKVVDPPTGLFDPIRANNDQRGHVIFTDTELNFYRTEGYRWSWKRMDDGSETILAWGAFSPQKATAP